MCVAGCPQLLKTRVYEGDDHDKVERGEASAGLNAIVVSKLSSNEMFIPI